MADLLSVEGLAKSFGSLEVLTDLEFQVRQGEIIGLLGPNGSGKSTALNVISGFLPATRGAVRLNGADITRADVGAINRAGLVRTFQLPSMPSRMTVREVLQAGQAGHSPWRRATNGPEIDEILTEFKLSHVADNPATALSGGQKKLLSVAAALRTDPALLCLDEPTAGVHVTLRTDLVRVLKAHAARGRSCLIVEHDMLFIRDVCTRCVVLDRGRIIADCPPALLETHPAVIEAYLGRAVEVGGMAS